MSDQIALALIAAVVPVVATIGGNLILTWRVAIAANTAVEQARIAATNATLAAQKASIAEERAGAAVKAATVQGDRNAVSIEAVHQSVNGGMAAAKKEIVELKAEVVRLNKVIGEDK